MNAQRFLVDYLSPARREALNIAIRISVNPKSVLKSLGGRKSTPPTFRKI
jgi:hypothetical protein